MANKKGLAILRKDFESYTGKPFEHFHCPILDKDEDVPVIDGHIINQAIPNMPRITVPQRKDVDNFYGMFESEFVTALRYKDYTLEQIMSDDKASKQLRPFIVVNDTPYKLYVLKSTDKLPANHVSLSFEFDKTKLFGVDIDPKSAERSAELGEAWTPTWEKDARLHAIPVLIKAAHLTMFRLLGYTYAMSISGTYISREILGKFFVENHGKGFDKAQIENNAKSFFPRFIRMFRTVNVKFKGTLKDGIVVLCASNDRVYKRVIWGIIVFFDFGAFPMQAVVLPAGGTLLSLGLYFEFLRGRVKHFETQTVKFNGSKAVVRGNWKPIPEEW